MKLKNPVSITVFITILVLGAKEIGGATLYVSQSSPAPASPYATWETAAHTVQEAVDAASDGDTVLVAEGSYPLTNQITVAKAILLQSTGGAGQTTLARQAINRCLGVFNSGAVVDGFTMDEGNGGLEGGGGVFLVGGTVQNCTIHYCSTLTELGGGGVHMIGGILSNCIVTKTFNGSQVFCSNGGLITDCRIVDTFAVANKGGGVYLTDSRLRNSTISMNRSVDRYGAATFGGGVYAVASRITGCIIADNWAFLAGGGAYLDACEVDRCIIERNTSSNPFGSVGGLGGGVFATTSTIRNSLIAGNRAYGGDFDTVPGFGGGVHLRGGSLFNCTVTANRAVQGGGIYIETGLARNSIAYFNSARSNANWYNVGAGLFDHTCTTPDPGGAGNLVDDPQFVDRTNQNYRLAQSSPCIDAGLNEAWMSDAADLDGNPRIQNGTVDLGAWESTAPVVAAGESTAPVVASSGPPLPPVLAHSLFNPSITVQPGVLQGSSVAMDGNIVVVGIPGAPGADNVRERNSGAVKVYDATTGALLHTLKNPTPPPPPKPPGPPDFYPDGYDRFGHCVAIAGTLIVVGAPSANVPEVRTDGRIDPYATYRDAGTAYIYDLASSTPTEPVAALNSPEPTSEEWFGYSVAISGRQVVVGAPNQIGSIYVYDLTQLPTVVPVLLATINNPNPSGGGSFGYSVALSAAAAAVGAPFDDIGGTNAGNVYVYDIGDRFTRSVPVAVLTNPDPAANDSFGASVAITSKRVLVGAPYDDAAAADAGSAYVYEYSLDRITPAVLIATLTSPAPAASDLYGYSVSASGDSLAVGTHAAESTYIYDFASLTPTSPAATLSNPNPATDDRFGYSVAVSGIRVLVGAPYDDTRALDAGSAYLFDLASPTPTTVVATMDDPIPGTGGNGGKSVAVSGNTVVVGAATGTYIYDVASSTPAAPVVTLNARGASVAVAGTLVIVGVPSENAAYVYDLANATPTEPIIILTNPAAAGSFGSSVAISGTQIAVGAPGGGPGSVYVYDLLSVTPVLPVVTLDNPVGHPSFGWSLSLSDTRVMVGAPTDDIGRAYVYHLASATPAVPVATLTNPLSTLTSRYFAWSVSVSGTRAVVGAPRGDEGDPGVAYVYDLEGATPATPIATLNNPNPGRQGLDRNPDMFGYSVAISGTLVVVGTPFEAMQADSAGVAYVYDLASLTPTTAATLFNPSPGVFDVFGMAVAVDGSNIVVGAPGDDTNGMDQGAAYVFRPIN